MIKAVEERASKTVTQSAMPGAVPNAPKRQETKPGPSGRPVQAMWVSLPSA